MFDKAQIEKTVNFAKAKPEISVIYLFGSHASDHERTGSDIDLGRQDFQD